MTRGSPPPWSGSAAAVDAFVRGRDVLHRDGLGGWGLGGHLFTSVYFAGANVGGRLFIVFGAMLFCFAAGAFSASLFMRWRMNGILVAGAVLALAVVGAVALITLTESWPAVGTWFAASGPVGVTAWLLVPTALAAAAAYLVLGRATPRN